MNGLSRCEPCLDRKIMPCDQLLAEKPHFSWVPATVHPVNGYPRCPTHGTSDAKTRVLREWSRGFIQS